MTLAHACRLGLGLLVLSLPVLAQAGELQGHVQLASSHKPAAGARIEIQGTKLTATTDANGNYLVPNLAPGSYTLIVKIRGQSPLQRAITITADSPSVENFSLDADTKLLDQITVTAPVTTAAIEARAQQQQAPNMIFVTTATDIQALPDINAGEAVRRLPGISLETDTGEGRYVNIRGLDADLNSTTFDGVRLMPSNESTPTGGGRAVAFDSIPSGLVGAMTVTNTNMPDQDAEALGGTIEITSKQMPADRDQFLDVQLGTGTENLRDTPVKDYEMTGGMRFGPSANYKPFSVIGTLNYYQDRRGIDDLEEAYNETVPYKGLSDLAQRYYNYQRTRHGYGIEFDFQPNENNMWYARYYDAGYTELKNTQKLYLDFAGNPVVDPNDSNTFIDEAGYKKEDTIEKVIVDTRVMMIGGKNNFDSWKTDYNVALSIGSFNQPYDYGVTFKNKNPNPANPDGSNQAIVAYDNNTNSNYPTYTILQGSDPANPAGYKMDDFSNATAHDHDMEYSAADNIVIPTTFFADSDNEFVKFGINARLRTRNNSQQNWDYSPPSEPLSSNVIGQPFTYYDGYYNMGPNINTQGIINQFLANPSLFPESDPLSDLAANLEAWGHDSENVYAGYFEYNFQPFDKLSILGGARYELTDAQYDGLNVLTNNGDLVSYSPNNTHQNYGNVFPSLQLKYSFDTDLIMRAVYSKTIARPGFQQVTPSTQADNDADTVTIGNPRLKPTYSNNFDMSLEYYLPEGGLASAGIFNKQMTNYIVQTGTIETVGNNPTGVLGQFSPGDQVTFTSFENIASAFARGMQLVYVDRFRWLPGALSGLGVNSNFTYVDSRIEIHPGIYSLLPSTSRDTANLALTYDYRGLHLDLGAYYESKNIFTVGSTIYTLPNGTPVYGDQWSDARTSLDFGASYAINDTVSFYFGAKNLTNTKLRFTETAAFDRPIQREFYDQTFTAGVRLHF